MEKGERKKRILSVFILLCIVTVVSCFSARRSGEGVPDEGAEAAAETGGNGEGTVSASAGTETDFAAADGEKTREGEGAEEDFTEDKLVFGRGIECEETLSEDVVLALKNGDTEYLVGVPFGEEFDYDLYESMGRECRRKESMYDWYLRYLFEGEGHRFSGFSISSSGDSFLGLNLKECPAAVFIKAFGEPDVREKLDVDWEGGVLRTDWYFEKAVLTVEEYNGYMREIEYRALGDIADGDGVKKKSDFDLRMETRSEDEKAEAVWGLGFNEHEKDVLYSAEEDEGDARSADEFVEKYLQEQGFGDQEPDSIIYNEEGGKFAESYINKENNKFAFIIYMGNGVCCAVRNLRGTDEASHIVYSLDGEGNTVQETLYDKWGMRAAEASYRYYDGVPFPFITESWNLWDVGWLYLCREHKTWFHEESVEEDKEGRVKATGKSADWNPKEYLCYPCFYTYRPDGKLERIQEEIPEEMFAEELLEYRESYFGYMEFSYEDGVLNRIDHHRSGQVYMTTDQSGTIDFDGQGRMVHRYYYVTSGCHDEFYFYHGRERRPWAVIDWCGVIWGVDVYMPVTE